MSDQKAGNPKAGNRKPVNPTARAGRPAEQERGEVRIVAGLWRSRRLVFPAVPGLRPTPDRVRETLFNWLGQDLTGYRCLDLYAGSGALGFEALSRGAARVRMVERDPAVFRALEANARLLQARGLELRRGDALEFLRSATGSNTEPGSEAERYDLVFLDPPFGAGLAAEVLGALERLPPLLAGGARVYVESGQAFAAPAPWVADKRGRAGQVHFQLLRLERLEGA